MLSSYLLKTLLQWFINLNFLFLFQFGKDKDLYGPRFAKNLKTTFTQLYKCPEDEKVKYTFVYFFLKISIEAAILYVEIYDDVTSPGQFLILC